MSAICRRGARPCAPNLPRDAAALLVHPPGVITELNLRDFFNPGRPDQHSSRFTSTRSMKEPYGRTSLCRAAVLPGEVQQPPGAPKIGAIA